MKSTPAPGDRVWTYLHGKAQEVKVYAVDILIISQDAKGGPELRRIPADRLYEDEAAVLRDHPDNIDKMGEYLGSQGVGRKP